MSLRPRTIRSMALARPSWQYVYTFGVLAWVVFGFADAWTYAQVNPAAPVVEMSPLARALGYNLLAGVLCKGLVAGIICLYHLYRRARGGPVAYEIGLIWFLAIGFAYGAWTNVSLG
jgi:hypothetical protein